MKEKQRQYQAIFGGMSKDDMFEFYSSDRNLQEDICRERLRAYGLKKTFDKASCDIQYSDGEPAPFQKVILGAENFEDFKLKAQDFLEFYIEKVDSQPGTQAFYHGIHMKIKKSANRDIVYRYLSGKVERDPLFDRLIRWNDILDLTIDNKPRKYVRWQECEWASCVLGCSVSEEMNGGQLTFLDDEGNLVLYIE